MDGQTLLFAAGLCVLACANSATAGDVGVSLSLSPEWQADNPGSPYAAGAALAPPRRRALREDLGLRWQEGGINAQGTLRQLAVAGRTPERHGIVNQLYYDGEIDAGSGWTAGRKLMSWGVGQGFRPLDVVQREDRRSVNPPPLVGIPVLAYERFSAADAFSLVWQRPGTGRGGKPGEDGALAAHWFRLVDGTDLHAVARLSRRNGLEAGGGFSRTVGDEWSFHGAVLHQGRFERRFNRLAEADGPTLATSDPGAVEVRRNAIKAVAGAQWTHGSGFGVLMEAWVDGESYNLRDWRRLNALTARQRALAGQVPQSAIDGNVAWSLPAFDAPNLMRENVMLRLTQDIEQRWQLALDWLATRRDGGRAVTLSLGHQGDRARVAGGIRWLGGAGDSALAQAPASRMAWLEWRVALR